MAYSTDVSVIATLTSSIYTFDGDGSNGVIYDKDNVNNTIITTGENVTIDAQGGADTINSSGKEASILAGGGNDSILSTGKASTIYGGAGDDTIHLGLNNVAEGGDGADTFIHYNNIGNIVITDYGDSNKDDVLVLSETDTFTKTTSGDNYVIAVGEDRITLKGAAASLASDGINPLRIRTKSNYEYLTTARSSVSLIGNASNSNTIESSGSNNTITGGSSADSIVVSGSNNVISVGSGNDNITVSGDNNTIYGGIGNDYANLASKSNLYKYGGGDDSIFAYDTSDTIQIVDNSITIDTNKTTLDGDDVILVLSNNSSITVKNAKTTRISVANSDGSAVSGYLYNSTSDIFDVINYVMSSNGEVTPTDPNSANYIVNYGDKNTIKAGGGDDKIELVHSSSDEGSVIYYSNSDSDGDGNDTITGFANTDTVYLDSVDTLGASVSGNDVIINTGKGTITLVNAKSKNVQISNGDSISTIYNGNATLNLNTSDQLIYGAGSGNQTINGLDGNINFIGSTTTVSAVAVKSSDVTFTIGSNTLTIAEASDKKLQIVDSNGQSLGPQIYGAASIAPADEDVEENGTISAIFNSNVVTIDASEGISKSIYLIGNDKANVIVGATDKSNTLYGGKGNDSLTGGSDKDYYLYSSGKDVITDYQSSDTDVIQIVDGTNATYSAYTISGADVIFTIGGSKDNVLTVKNGKNKKITFVDSVGAAIDDVSIVYRSDKELIVTDDYVSGLDASLKSGDIATITAADTKVTLIDASLEYTGTNKLYIVGNESADTLIASKNDDTLYGGGTKADTLVGGEGANKFAYKAGDGADVIVDYDPDKDQIYFLDTATTIASSTLNTKTGAVVFNITDQAGKNKSSITIQNAQDKPITFKNENGLITKQVFGNKNYEIQSSDVTTKATIDVTANTAVVTLDGSGISSDLYLIGNSGNNLIIGGGGDDTLQGKTGKDTMTGGNGNNVFAFGSNDGTANWITDYGDNDTLMAISGAVTSVATIKNSSDMTATIGKTKVRIKDLKGKKLTVVDSLGSASSQVVGVNLIEVANDDIITDEATLNTALNATLITINAADVTKDFAIVANAKNNYVVTGDSNETISTGAGKDTIEVSATGKTITIKDYTAGSDVLKLSNGTTIDNATIVAASGDIAEHVQLTIKNSSNTSNVDVFGTITTSKKNVKSYGKITVNDGDGNTFAQAFGGTAITVANGDGATIDATVNPTVANIYAGKRSKAVTIIGNSNNNSITGGTKGDTIIAGSAGDTLNGAAGNDMLISTISGSVTMIGGAGADTIQAHSSDNYITTGAGKDVIVISTGDTGTDIISDYTAGSDKISLDGTISLSTASLEGTSVVLEFKGNGSTDKILKLTNMRDKKITIVDKDGNFTSQPYAASTLTIVNSDGDTIDASTDANADVTTINAKKRSKAVNIIGNVKDNSIIGGSKGDTLSGGTAGTNTLTGGKGNDFFVYEGGDVIITDYSVAKNNADEIVLADGLMLKTLSTVNNDWYYVDGKDVIFVVSNSSDTVGTINVKNGKDKAITFNGSDSSYSKTYNDYTEKVFAKKDSTNTYTASSEDKRIKTINAKSKSTAVYIIGNNFADGTISTITGSAKVDTLQGGSGDDSLIGGKGADIFVFSGGSDTISDYVVGTDIVSITGTSVNATPTYEGNYLKVTTAKNGTLYINNAKNKKGVEQKIKFMENGVVTSQVYGLSSISIGANDGATISANTTINQAVTTLDANKRKTAVVLVGNSNNNTLIGGSGADSLYATSGNNSLVGGAGKDTMIGGSGKDTFYGGAGDDVVSLASSHDNSVINYNAGNDIVYSFGTGDVIKVADNQKIETATEVTAGTEYKLIVKNNKGKSVGTIDLKNSTFQFSTSTDTTTDSKKQIATTTTTWYVEVGGQKAAYKTESTTESTKASSYQERIEELIADDNFATTNDLDNILSTSADSTAITGEIINPTDSTQLTTITATVLNKKKNN